MKDFRQRFRKSHVYDCADEKQTKDRRGEPNDERKKSNRAGAVRFVPDKL
jgi:hypothetical protein